MDDCWEDREGCEVSEAAFTYSGEGEQQLESQVDYLLCHVPEQVMNMRVGTIFGLVLYFRVVG